MPMQAEQVGEGGLQLGGDTCLTIIDQDAKTVGFSFIYRFTDKIGKLKRTENRTSNKKFQRFRTRKQIGLISD